MKFDLYFTVESLGDNRIYRFYFSHLSKPFVTPLIPCGPLSREHARCYLVDFLKWLNIPDFTLKQHQCSHHENFTHFRYNLKPELVRDLTEKLLSVDICDFVVRSFYV